MSGVDLPALVVREGPDVLDFLCESQDVYWGQGRAVELDLCDGRDAMALGESVVQADSTA